jgi:Domain of unknown function (DUF1918)
VPKSHQRIAVASDRAGLPPREGEILEVIDSPFGRRYRVRWDNGRESTVSPRGGTVTVQSRREPRT